MSDSRVHGTVKVSSSLIRLVVGRGRAGDGRWLQRMITTHDRNMLPSFVLSSVRRQDAPSRRQRLQLGGCVFVASR